jgi:hypothetical protein
MKVSRIELRCDAGDCKNQSGSETLKLPLEEK